MIKNFIVKYKLYETKDNYSIATIRAERMDTTFKGGVRFYDSDGKIIAYFPCIYSVHQAGVAA